jgi:hypothetical protein
MRTKLLLCILSACFVSAAAADDRSNQLVEKATQIFGNSLNLEHQVFRLNERYFLWLITDTTGNLLEVAVGPKSYYSSEFVGVPKLASPEYLSESEYDDALSRISELKDVGDLQERHYAEGSSQFGPFQTDRFKQAFVERILHSTESSREYSGVAWKFNVYFLQDVSGSPKQIETPADEPAQVCVGNEWYYVAEEDARRLQLGRWHTFQAAGPSITARPCFRTTPLYDANGFTIEEPQNETIVASEPCAVRTIIGRVHLGGTPLEGVNVEVLRAASKKVLRTRTDAHGNFGFSGLPEGKYKFRVTKDGFKSFTGTIVVDPDAPEGMLSFELPVGT